MPLYDDLKALSVHLSPSVRVAGSEVADVLSALVAYAEHGQPILQVAQDGPQAVYDLLHEHQVKLAAADGRGVPVKGQPLQSVPAPGRFGPPPAVSRSDFEKLTALVEQLVAGLHPVGHGGLTPDQELAVQRARQTIHDAEAQADREPTPADEIPAPATWPPAPEAA